MFSQGSEWQQQDPRPFAGALQMSIGAVTQCLERRCVAGLRGGRTGLFQRRLGQIGKLTDAGDGGAAVRDITGTTCPDLVNTPCDVVPGFHETAVGLDVLKV